MKNTPAYVIYVLVRRLRIPVKLIHSKKKESRVSIKSLLTKDKGDQYVL
jgi:hypothetical protein